LCVALLYGFALAQVILIPQNNMDSLSTHLSRIGFWHQLGSFFPWPTFMLNQVWYPVNAQLQTYWTLLFLAAQRPVENVMIIVVTSDRGLCGGYNSNLIKLAKQVINEKYPQQFAKGKVQILPIGKKGYENFTKNGFKVVNQYWDIFTGLSFDKVQAAAKHVMDAFANKEIDAVELIFSEFKNAATQRFVAEQFLPVPKVDKVEGQKNADFIYEPGKDVLIAELMPKILNTQLFKATLDANASEHGARMTAMDKASDNANELLKSLKISYNRARQAAITTELTEIVSGAAALQG
jgi:F-type H+-transporting ATPase subunit gamma